MSVSMEIKLPSAVESLVDSSAFASYGMLTANEASLRSRLETLDVEQLFDSRVKDFGMAQCCVSGLWLLHNFLDESHSISQNLSSAEGSYWHAIMHRWEGDFSNAKYWYRHVGPHPVIDRVAGDCGGSWNPFDYVDQCEHESRRGGLTEPSRQIAVSEWKRLFEYCFKQAIT